MADTLSIVVLREDVGPASVADYAEHLREALPDHEVRLARTPGEERKFIETADVATGVRIDENLLDHAESLRLFACSWAGTGHLPLDALEKRGVTVTNASGVHAPGIAAQVLGTMLAFTRNLHVSWRRQQDRQWEHIRAGELDGDVVTVVGLGAIGQAVTERLSGFDVHTIGVRYTPSKDGPTDEVVGFDARPFNDALARSDHVVLACPLTETTRGLVGHEEFVTMPPDAVLVNVARGAVVDTDALVWALREDTIGGAALDVTDPEPLPDDHPLWGFDDVLITPHMGGETPHLWKRLADILEQNVRTLIATGSPEDLKNRVL